MNRLSNLLHQFDVPQVSSQPIPGQSSAPDCEACGGLGLIQFNVEAGHPWFGKLFPCEHCEKGRELLLKAWMNNLASAGLPAKYQRLTFESWSALPKDIRKGKLLAENVCRLFVNDPQGWVSIADAYLRAGHEWRGQDLTRNSVILQGAMGLGKTSLAAAIVNWRAQNKLPTFYVRLQSFLTEVTNRYSEHYEPTSQSEAKTPGEVLDLAKRAPVLVMDEINLEGTPSDHSRKIFEEIVRHRAGAELPTVYTCNLDTDGLVQHWNGRAVDVLFESAHFIPMGGVPIRNMTQTGEVF